MDHFWLTDEQSAEIAPHLDLLRFSGSSAFRVPKYAG